MSKGFQKGHKINLGKKRTKENIIHQINSRRNNGKPWVSDKTREKISKKLKGNIPWNKGKKCQQLSISQKGENNSFWKGGISSLSDRIRHLFQYRQWRSDVFTRDNFTCQECGDDRGGNLEAHHEPESLSDILEKYRIKTIEEALACEELWNINKGRTLCEDCHKKTKTYLKRRIK